jgi:hypothetical protein
MWVYMIPWKLHPCEKNLQHLPFKRTDGLQSWYKRKIPNPSRVKTLVKTFIQPILKHYSTVHCSYKRKMQANVVVASLSKHLYIIFTVCILLWITICMSERITVTTTKILGSMFLWLTLTCLIHVSVSYGLSSGSFTWIQQSLNY